MTRKHARGAIAVLLVSAVLTLTACGGGGGRRSGGSDSTGGGSSSGGLHDDDDDDDDFDIDVPDTDGTAGAGGEAGDQPAQSADGEEAALEQAVSDLVTALFTPNGTLAYDSFSTRCQTVLTLADVELAAQAAVDRYGHRTMESFSVDSMTATTAEVSYGVGIEELDGSAEPWVLEADGWRLDDC
ncbi:hypothetical protein [Streptomyces sp. SBT349]|uniref:hypothetical protein n=1 Tax=Streptomyces sp. SBT349 TaxID=1580539 RepID=UPI00066D8F12|nr:hypothetical protein [Streptomyces sp. SBT349]